MSFEDFGGRIDPEARRLAYMLNTGDPNAEHQAAMQLSQDLYRLPGQAQVDLVRSTQMYDANAFGGQLVVDPVYNNINGRPYDTGNRQVRVIDNQDGVNDYVGNLNGNNAGYRMPGARFDLFAGIYGCTLAARPWEDGAWRDRMSRERHGWHGWENYDGRNYGRDGFVRPSFGVGFNIGGVEIGVGVNAPIIGGPIFGRLPIVREPDPRERERERIEREKRERERHNH